MDSSSNLPRPSGIPRPAPSRLPVLRPSGSQPQLRSPASSSQLRKKPSVAAISRPLQPAQTYALPKAPAPAPASVPAAAATVQRKPSRISLVPSYTPSTAAAPAPKLNTSATLTKKPSRASLVPSSARRASGIPGSGLPPPRSASLTQSAPAFKKPFARPPSRQNRTPSQPLRTPSISKDDDVLGSLDGFRSASRASSRAGSRAGFHESSSSPEYVADVEADEAAKRTSRPSLSDRTIESLSQLPSSPANGKGRRRRSSFFNQDNSMPPPLRPASAMSNKSSGSRPTTSDGMVNRLPVTPSKSSAPSARLSMTVPGKRSASAVSSTPATTPSRISSISRPTTAIKKPALVPVHNGQTPSKPASLPSSKSLVSRTPKPRSAVPGTFGQAISPPGTAAAPSPPPPTGTARKVPSSSAALRNSIAQAKAAQRQVVAESPDETPKKAENSSNALREQIAKAREAAKRNKAGPVRADTPPKDAIIPDPDEIAGFDFGLGDPFNQGSKGGKSVLRKRVDGARATGRLNIAGMQLSDMPDEVLRMYDPNDTAVAWGEIVDVTTIVAADNELETLPDSMFPDVDMEDLIDSDDAGPQFGGVQSLDFHGNLLRELPMGFRRLAELTKLNLSRNKLDMGALEVITQVTCLRELKLAENNLTGELSSNIASLTQLEVLDIASNKLIGLPAEIRELAQLRSLNVADNQLRAIPMGLFTLTSLIELTATKNRIEGTFFTIESAPHLQDLRLSNNAITSLSESATLSLPALKCLDLSANRLSSLPDMTSWTNLSTLLLGENKVTAFPGGFLSLQQLRIADFTANDITKVDERIALMRGLENLTLAANPIRERKFLTMSTDDMKRDLALRLQPKEVGTVDDEVDEFTSDEQTGESFNGWTVTPSGTLDLTNMNFRELDENALVSIAETSDIRQINLQNNLLQMIPTAFAQLPYLTILDLSKNCLSSPLTSPLNLPKLRELRLSGNKLNSLTSLTAHLTAPSLQNLDVSLNRLTGTLPRLRDSFPALITLIASDNAMIEVPAESLFSLRIVNLSNNNIERLDPRIGLHAGTLTSLIVEGNTFRVPNYQVLSKGTDAILSWLKDKIPRDSGRGRGDSWASQGTTTETEGGSEFFDAEDGVDAW